MTDTKTPGKTIALELHKLIQMDRDVYFDLAHQLWQRPELSFEEKFAVELQIKLLREWGFKVEAPYGGLETAYRAESGSGEPVFAIASEYDALPGLGHGCGHNLICAAALAAGHAVKQHLEATGTKGRIIILGTPAEEGGSGKVMLERAGCLEGVGATMMVHPRDNTNTTDAGCLALERVDVEYFGKSSHAGGSPELGLNALDAMLLFFNSVACWRQHIPEDARVHGVILEGGRRPNIIPDYTKASFYIRSATDLYLAVMKKRFQAMAESAATMTGCTCKATFSEVGTKARRPNKIMNQRYREAMEALGQVVVTPEKTGRGSTDYGNFSAARPGIHPYFAVSTEKFAGHSIQMVEAAGSDYGRENMLRAAAAMADVAWAFLSDPGFHDQVLADFAS